MQAIEADCTTPCWPSCAPLGGRAGSRLLPTALLVLLAEQESHGYDLAVRLADLGVTADLPAIYRSLRSLDGGGFVQSTWDTSPRGPARRVYALTEDGRLLLGSSLAAMEEAWSNISRLLARSRRVAHPEGTVALVRAGARS